MKNINKILAVSFIAMLAVPAAQAKIVSETMLSSEAGHYSGTHTVQSEIDAKQDTISDLATIRSGAAKGATSVQSVALASGTNNGTVKLTVNGTATDNIAVKGLGAAAYKAVDTTSGGTASSGSLITSGAVNSGLATKQNIQIGAAKSGSTASTDSGKAVVVDDNGKIAMGNKLGTAAYQNTTDTYSSTGTAPVSGKAVASAISGVTTTANSALQTVTANSDAGVVTNVAKSGTAVTMTKSKVTNAMVADDAAIDVSKISGAQTTGNMESTTTSYDTSSTTKYPSMAVAQNMIDTQATTINTEITNLKNNKQNKIAAGTAGNVVTYSGTAGTVGSLGFDTAPTANSTNLVKSGAIKTALDTKQNIQIGAAKSGSTASTDSGKAVVVDDNGKIAMGNKLGTAAYQNTTDTYSSTGTTPVSGKAVASAISGVTSTANSAIQSVKVNGTALSPDSNKAVNVTVASGSTNGTIAVNGSDVAVKGLGSAAYQNTTDTYSSTGTAPVSGKAVASAISGVASTANSALQTVTANSDAGVVTNVAKSGTAVTMTKAKVTNAMVADNAAIASSKIADLAKVTSAEVGNKDGVYVLTAKVENGTAQYYWEDIGR